MEENKNNEEYEDIPLKGIRKIIAARMTESKSTVPHFYLTIEIDMEKLIELRKSLNADDGDKKITFNVVDLLPFRFSTAGSLSGNSQLKVIQAITDF